MNTVKIGAITIGQAPRDDIVIEMEEQLAGGFDFLQAGAVDDFSYREIEKKFSPAGDETILVSRMRDGKEIKLAENKIIPLLQEKINLLEKEVVDVILMLCTGDLPELESSILLIKPQNILQVLMESLQFRGKLGMIVPDRAQIEQILKSWSGNGYQLEIKAASPYEDKRHLEKVADEFKDSNLNFIFMNCMGYSKEMKNIVKKISGKNVILARSMLTSIVGQMF